MNPRVIPALSGALALALALAACPGKKQDTTARPPNTAPKRALVGWSTTNQAPKGDVPQVEVFLQVTDETGKSVAYPVGTYEGTCTASGPQPKYQALIVMTCVHAQKGWQLHTSGAGAQIVVSKLPYTEGTEPDPFTRQEVTSVPVPVGASIEPAPM